MYLIKVFVKIPLNFLKMQADTWKQSWDTEINFFDSNHVQFQQKFKNYSLKKAAYNTVWGINNATEDLNHSEENIKTHLFFFL